MKPELQRLTDELTEVRAAVAATEDTARTATNGWTVAQVLDHLTKIHNATVPRFEAALAAAPDAKGEEAVRYSFIDRQLIKVMSGQSFKIPVPPMFEPGAAGPEAKAACLASIDALLATIRHADGKALAGLKVSSPVSDRLKLGLLAYLDATVEHARYHRAQI